jgi:chromosome segregation ATPase
MKLANPLNYPLAVLIAGLALFIGVRLINLSSVLMLPLSTSVAFFGSALLAAKTGNKSAIVLENKVLAKELNQLKKDALVLVSKATNLREEAKNLLQDSDQINLLITVEYICDSTSELPEKIEALIAKISGGDSLLSVKELEQKLREIKAKEKTAQGEALKQLQQLEQNLQRNISLAEQGKSTREAQVLSLSNLISQSGGILQELQNQLRSADLNNSQTVHDLETLSQELTDIQQTISLF